MVKILLLLALLIDLRTKRLTKYLSLGAEALYDKNFDQILFDSARRQNYKINPFFRVDEPIQYWTSVASRIAYEGSKDKFSRHVKNLNSNCLFSRMN